jgi:hypothetical protein
MMSTDRPVMEIGIALARLQGWANGSPPSQKMNMEIDIETISKNVAILVEAVVSLSDSEDSDPHPGHAAFNRLG